MKVVLDMPKLLIFPLLKNLAPSYKPVGSELKCSSYLFVCLSRACPITLPNWLRRTQDPTTFPALVACYMYLLLRLLIGSFSCFRRFGWLQYWFPFLSDLNSTKMFLVSPSLRIFIPVLETTARLNLTNCSGLACLVGVT